MDKLKRDEAPIKVYKPALRVRIAAWLQVILFFLIGIPMLLFIVLLGGKTLIIAVFPLFIMLSTLRDAIMLTYYSAIAIYGDGLEIRQWRSRFFVGWDNMSYISHNGKHYGIYLYEKLEAETSGFLNRFLYGKTYDFLNLSTVVPILNAVFKNKQRIQQQLLNTEFGQQLLHYAPHLFEYGEEKAKNS